MAALGIDYGRMNEFLPDEDAPHVEPGGEREKLINPKLAKLRFFRDLSTAARKAVFAAFVGQEVADELSTHMHEAMLFDRLFLRPSRDAVLEEAAKKADSCEVEGQNWRRDISAAIRAMKASQS